MRTIVLVLLILIVPALFFTPPDDKSIQAHLATCPNCSSLDSNPIRCKVVMALGRSGSMVAGAHPSLTPLADAAAHRKQSHEGRHPVGPERQTHHHERSGRI